MTLFPDPLPITSAEVLVAKGLMCRYPTLGARDAIHAAAVITHKLEGIVSADQVFGSITEIRWLDPMNLNP